MTRCYFHYGASPLWTDVRSKPLRIAEIRGVMHSLYISQLVHFTRISWSAEENKGELLSGGRRNGETTQEGFRSEPVECCFIIPTHLAWRWMPFMASAAEGGFFDRWGAGRSVLSLWLSLGHEGYSVWLYRSAGPAMVEEEVWRGVTGLRDWHALGVFMFPLHLSLKRGRAEKGSVPGLRDWQASGVLWSFSICPSGRTKRGWGKELLGNPKGSLPCWSYTGLGTWR